MRANRSGLTRAHAADAGPVEENVSSTPLGQINTQASGLTAVTVPRGLLADHPADSPARLAYVRNLLLLTETPDEVKDRTWRYIGTRARIAGPLQTQWNLFALGMAYPGLRVRARRLAPPGSDWDRIRDVHFNLAVEFLFALHRLDLDTRNVASRLLGAAYDQASGRRTRRQPRFVDIDTANPHELHQARRDQDAANRDRDGETRSVLDRLVEHTSRREHRGPTLTRQHAELIARTYLDGHRLGDVAADLGMTLSNASKHRSRAATIIARALTHHHTPTAPTPTDPTKRDDSG